MTHKEIFESYVRSQRYINDYVYIKMREGEKYAILFDYVAKIYVRYFINGRGNKKRNPRKNQANRDVIIPKKDDENKYKSIDIRSRIKLKKKCYFKTY